MAASTVRVTRPPSKRSPSLPPTTRAIDPSSGPAKAISAACSAACPCVCPPAIRLWAITWPKANANPMNEPEAHMYRNEIVQVSGTVSTERT